MFIAGCSEHIACWSLSESETLSRSGAYEMSIFEALEVSPSAIGYKRYEKCVEMARKMNLKTIKDLEMCNHSEIMFTHGFGESSYSVFEDIANRHGFRMAKWRS